MAITYLQHPKHGTKVAISDMEVEFDLQNGWSEFNPSEPEETLPVEPMEAVESVNEMQPRRRGRRPREATE